MKLFGNTSGKKRPAAPAPRVGARSPDSAPASVPAPVPASIPHPVADAEPEPASVPVSASVAAPLPADAPEPVSVPDVPERRVRAEGFRSESASETAARRKKSAFRRGYLIYVLCFLLVIAAGLLLLWERMDVYERSRPERAVNAWLAEKSAADWRALLEEKGVDEAFLDTLNLSDAESYKKLDAYTEETPAFGIRFGGRTMLTATLAPGEALGFGSHAWVLSGTELTGSGLTVYAPEDAVLTVDGVPAGDDCLVQTNAQSLTLGVFERDALAETPGLAKYVINTIYTTDRLHVSDAEGRELPQSYSSGMSYYYPPLTSDYRITVPAGASVMANGVPVTEENAAFADVKGEPFPEYEIFAGIEDSVEIEIPSPDARIWTLEGLVARPSVAVSMPDGTELSPAEETENAWVYAWAPEVTEDAGFAAEQEEFILKVFDAYIAFTGNRGRNLNGNYARYNAYLVPDSDAAERARRALPSLEWVKNRDTDLVADSVEVTEVLRFGDKCFTAELTYETVKGEANRIVFAFVPYNGSWRVVRVMNR